MILWMEVIKRETAHSSLVATFSFFLGLFWSSVFFHRWRRGGSKSSDQPNTAWQPTFTAFCGFHFSICTDPQLMGKTTSYSLTTTPDRITAKAASRPPVLFPLTDIYILLCGGFHSFSFLSLLPLPHFLFSLSLSASLSHSLFSSQDPSHCWMAALPVCSHMGSLNLNIPLHSCHSLICFNSLHRHVRLKLKNATGWLFITRKKKKKKSI